MAYSNHDIEREKRSGGKGFALAKGDLAILGAVYEYRFLRREHLSLLTGRAPKRVHRRLLKLVQNGALATTRRPQQKHIYSIGQRGLSVLAEKGAILDDRRGRRLRVTELKELFLKHEMLVVDHHVLFVLAGNTGPLRLVEWREGSGLFDTVMVGGAECRKKLPVRPDAFFTIEDTRRDEGRNRFHFFLEIDRSTMPHTRFKEKIRAYWQYREQGLHARRLGLQSFRVLTVTLTGARARNLRDLAATILPEGARKNFLFAASDNYSLQDPKQIFGDIYLSPRAGGQHVRYPLITEPAT